MLRRQAWCRHTYRRSFLRAGSRAHAYCYYLLRPFLLLARWPAGGVRYRPVHRSRPHRPDRYQRLVVVSHDRDLLDRVDRIVDLSAGGVRVYGGNFGAYEDMREAEQAAAERDVTAAAADVRRQQRDVLEAQVKQARSDRQGRRLAASGSIPRIVAGGLKRHAQETAGRSGEMHAARLRAARDRLTQAQAAVRDDAEIRVSLPDTAVPSGRTVLTVTGLAGLDPLIVRGPERIALTGPNGAGKTTLLRALTGQAPLAGVTVHLGAMVGYLPQRLDNLDDEISVVDNVRAAAPAASVNAVRASASLARFLFRGKRADMRAGTLSGGERFRAVLATLLLAEPSPQLLLLDEPTNNLDMASSRQLIEALDSYQGALLIASHEVHFLRSVGITRWLRMDRATGMSEVNPLLWVSGWPVRERSARLRGRTPGDRST